MPANFRAVLTKEGDGEPDVILRPSSHSPCIDVWPKKVFEDEVTRRIKDLDPLSEEYDTITDDLTARAHETRVDAEGRIVLPRALLAEVPLDGSAVIVARPTSFQIWSAPVWAERQAKRSRAPQPPRGPAAGDAAA